MKAADISVGGDYLAEYEYGKRGKVTVLEVPVVRMVGTYKAGVKKPYRRDGRADGARVRVARTGDTTDVALAKVVREWNASDDEREEARADCIERVAALRAKLDELALPYEPMWRGEATTVERCAVELPFVAFEEWLRRVDPVEVARDALHDVLNEPGDLSTQRIDDALERIRQRWAAGFTVASCAPDPDGAF